MAYNFKDILSPKLFVATQDNFRDGGSEKNKLAQCFLLLDLLKSKPVLFFCKC